MALRTAGFVTLGWIGGGAHGSNGISRRAEFMVGHMSYRHRMASGARGFLGGTGRLAGGIVRCKGGSPGLSHGDLPPRPSTGLFDRLARAVVMRAHALEQMQDVLGAIGRPGGQQVMIGVLQGAAAAQGDEPGIPFSFIEEDVTII